MEPIKEPLSRAWLEEHGWKPATIFNGMGFMPCDLAVCISRREYIMARFHETYAADNNKWSGAEKPEGFDIVGPRATVFLYSCDFLCLIMAVFACGLMHHDSMVKAVDGHYNMTLSRIPPIDNTETKDGDKADNH